MSTQRNQTIVLTGGTWFGHTVTEPSIARPTSVSGQQAQGQLYCFYGPTPPPEATTATNFPGTPSEGFGSLTLGSPGQWWLLYNASAAQQYSLTVESIAGREPPPADGQEGMFYRAGATSVTIPALSAVQVFTANPRRKNLKVSTWDAPAGAYMLLRFDGTAANATNYDDAVPVDFQATYSASGVDVPKGAVSVFNTHGSAAMNVVCSQWE